MNTQLPVPERTLPRESADRIRTAILFEELDPRARNRAVNRWLLGLAAALVVVALLATAAVLWPSTRQTQVVERPTASPTPASAAPTPTPDWTMPTPTPAPSRTEPLEPGPKQDPLLTDRGALSDRKARALADECTSPEDADIAEVLYARRISNGRKGVQGQEGIAGKEGMDVMIYRQPGGEEWFCAPVSLYVPLDTFDPEIGPNASFPVITDSGQGGGVDQYGTTSDWVFRALDSVDRIQVRAVVDGKPKRWFEGEVHGGFAFIPVFTSGTFDEDSSMGGPPASATSSARSTPRAARCRCG